MSLATRAPEVSLIKGFAFRMIISGPGLRRGEIITNLTSLLDIYPTMVAMQGGIPPSDLDGFSLMPFLEPDSGGNSGESSPRNNFVTSQYHSNMGNTGSFMIRQGRWKYIAFGQNGHRFNGSCGADCAYLPQLFDIEADPAELKDLSKEEPEVVLHLDSLLRTEVDYPAVDLKCKKYDRLVYDKFIATRAKDSSAAWTKAYKGFDCGASNCGKDAEKTATGDWLKVERWLADPL